MPRIVILRDTFSRALEAHELGTGENLAAELMRLWPGGIEGAWHLYAETLTHGAELTTAQILARTIAPRDCFVMVRRPAGLPAVATQIIISLLLTAAAQLLTPKPSKRIGMQPASEQVESGTNEIAGQTNVLRPGARVPEILGRRRVYPDLMTNTVEVWTRRTQDLDQWFIVGAGDYLLEDLRLGDTPLPLVAGQSVQIYRPGPAGAAPGEPGEIVPRPPEAGLTVVKSSATVNGIDLNAVDGAAPPVAGISFAASSKTMTAPSAVTITPGNVITISGTVSNNGPDFVVSVSGAGPFVYQLIGPVANESGTTPVVVQWDTTFYPQGIDCYTNGDEITFVLDYHINAFHVGDAFELMDTLGAKSYGIIFDVQVTPIDFDSQTVKLTLRDFAGAPYSFPTATGVHFVIRAWRYPTPTGGAGGTDATDWQAVPMRDPLEVWLDFSFPQGLAKYVDNARQPMTVIVRADFCRDPAGPIVSTQWTYTEATNASMRWTQRVNVADLGLTGTAPLLVRVQRVTELASDSGTTSYLQALSWVALRGMALLPPRAYPQATLVRIRITNSRSASSLGENAFNCIAWRVLKTWSAGAGWSASAAPTDKWADNFVARCLLPDGANQAESNVDLAGIYALQAQLDAMDGGAQGKIALALDQLQDIDTELAQVADVVRASVYRLSKKIHVVRDQQTATRVALFNGRAKSVDAEAVQVRMKSADENDGVTLGWLDEVSGWKAREYTLPASAVNPARVSTACANWPQVWRRAHYELAKIKYRREQISVAVTEEGRICRPGDVVNITDDVANLALAAGEVIAVAGLTLTLDKEISFASGETTILLRDVYGARLDAIGVAAVSGAPHKVTLARAPSGIVVKGRDESLGTLYVIYKDGDARVRPWLVSSVAVAGPFVQLTGANYADRVYADDATALEPQPAPL